MSHSDFLSSPSSCRMISLLTCTLQGFIEYNKGSKSTLLDSHDQIFRPFLPHAGWSLTCTLQGSKSTIKVLKEYIL
jgi:hypothetical protein